MPTMIKLHSSKSYCYQQQDQSSNLDTLNRHYSTTRIINIKHTDVLLSVAPSHESVASSPSFDLLITQEDLYSIILSEQEKVCKATTAQVETLTTPANSIQLFSKKHDLTDIIEKNDLIKFVVKKDADAYNKSVQSESFVLEAEQVYCIDRQSNQTNNFNNEIDPFQMYVCEDFTKSTVDDEDLISSCDILTYPDSVRRYLLNMNVLSWPQGPKQIKFGCLRKKKSNKTTKLKSLLSNHNILSVCKNTSKNLNTKLKFSKHSLQKSNTRIHVKYHVYSKLQEILTSTFIREKDRAKCVYSIKQTGCSGLAKEVIEANKAIHRQLELADSRKSKIDEIHHGDTPVVINNSIEHGRLNNELTKTYDQIYLEFLISIQHREITPEDYEYLSRLDELIKKKTVSENILKSLKYEVVCEGSIGEEVCGICLEAYEVGQIKKQLPCRHKFHGDCIDQWLSGQSTDCPLDKIPVDTESIEAFNALEAVPDVTASVLECLKELVDKIELEASVEECLSALVDKVELNEKR